MSVHTYIGARYVPRFLGTYDPTTQYEALDVVDNGAGTSYIARKIVPPNTPLTDTDYWFVYGASSGAIIQLQNDMIQAQNDITGLGNDMTSAQNDILGLQGDVADLEALLLDRRMVVISDSYGLVRGGNTPWTTIFQTLTGLSNSDYFTFSEGSMGINRAGDNGHTVIQLMQAHESDITDHDTITDVVIALGANDIYATSGLATAIDTLFNYIKTEYPNAKLWLGYIGNLETKGLTVYNDYIESVNQYVLGAGRNDAAYITGCEYVMHNCQYFQSDGIHPTTDGCQAIAEFINAFMQGGASFVYSDFISITSSVFGSDSNIRQTIDNGIVTMNLTLSNTIAALTLAANGTPVACGTLSDPVISGIGGAIHYETIYIYDGTRHQACQWYVYNQTLYVRSVSGALNIPTGANSFANVISYATLES